MTRKTLFELTPDDVDAALRATVDVTKMHLSTDGIQVFGYVLTDKEIMDACQAYVCRSFDSKAGNVWHWELSRDNFRVKARGTVSQAPADKCRTDK